MKTTPDLPGDFMRKIRQRALDDNRKFKEAGAYVMRTGLLPASSLPGKVATVLPKILPVPHAVPGSSGDAASMSAQELSDWMKRVDADLEVEHL